MAGSAQWSSCPVCQHPVAEHTAMRGWVTEVSIIIVCTTCRLAGQQGVCQNFANPRW